MCHVLLLHAQLNILSRNTPLPSLHASYCTLPPLCLCHFTLRRKCR
jgi:hypothetical protein